MDILIGQPATILALGEDFVINERKRKRSEITQKPRKKIKIKVVKEANGMNILDLPVEILAMIARFAAPTLAEGSRHKEICSTWYSVFKCNLNTYLNQIPWTIIVTEATSYGVLGDHVRPPIGNYTSIHYGRGGVNAIGLYQNAVGFKGYITPSPSSFEPVVQLGFPIIRGMFHFLIRTYDHNNLETKTSVMDEPETDEDDNDEMSYIEDPDFDFLTLTTKQRKSILGDYDIHGYVYSEDEFEDSEECESSELGEDDDYY